MKTALICLLLAAFVASCFADDATKQTTKTSKGALDVEAEVAAFYERLITSDAEVQKQMEALTATQRQDYGDHYHAFAVQVVQWSPYELDWDVNKGYREETGHYLVIQNVGLGRSKNVEYDAALVAEIEAEIETTTTKADSRHPYRHVKVLSTQLTLRFLGFRNMNLTAAPLAP